MMCHLNIMCFFFFNDTATTEIYTLSLHDALPISRQRDRPCSQAVYPQHPRDSLRFKRLSRPDRKSTRLNSSHGYISYAVFCLKKKNIYNTYNRIFYTYQPTHTSTIIPANMSSGSL